MGQDGDPLRGRQYHMGHTASPARQMRQTAIDTSPLTSQVKHRFSEFPRIPTWPNPISEPNAFARRRVRNSMISTRARWSRPTLARSCRLHRLRHRGRPAAMPHAPRLPLRPPPRPISRKPPRPKSWSRSRRPTPRRTPARSRPWFPNRKTTSRSTRPSKAMTTTILPSFPTRKKAMRTSPTSSVMSEATKRLEIGPELCSGSPPRVAQGLREHGRIRPCLDCEGAIAQLGERLHGMQEVGGSIPPGSTSLRRLRLLRLGKPAELPLSEASEGCRGVARRAKPGSLQLCPFACLLEQYPANTSTTC